VRPAGEPLRVDVIGDDSRRHGWASLLVTFGTSILARRQQLIVLDLTGQDAGGGIATLAEEQGWPVRRLNFPADLAGISRIPPDAQAARLEHLLQPVDRAESS
jgi:hypothetical protein